LKHIPIQTYLIFITKALQNKYCMIKVF
jgi:hypothetical protein